MYNEDFSREGHESSQVRIDPHAAPMSYRLPAKRERDRERYMKVVQDLRIIVRDLIRNTRLVVKIAHATPMPTLPSHKGLVSNDK